MYAIRQVIIRNCKQAASVSRISGLQTHRPMRKSLTSQPSLFGSKISKRSSPKPDFLRSALIGHSFSRSLTSDTQNVSQVSDLLVLRRSIINELNKAVRDEMKDFTFPSLEAEEAKRNEEHRSYLQQFYKAPLSFNPLQNGVDIRFLQKQTEDQVYDLLVKHATGTAKPGELKNIYTLRAISGGGKTGAVLNAIGRNAYLIYMDCRKNEKGELQDFDDYNFKAFHDELASYVRSPETRREDRTIFGQMLCSAFVLSRLLLLDYMKQNFKEQVNPTSWLFWSTNGGRKHIRTIQDMFIQIVKSHIAKGRDHITTMQQVLSTLLEHHKDDAWIAFDEAQEICDYSLRFQQMTEQEERPGDLAADPRRSLLHVLSVYALPPSSKRIILGTGMTDFTQIIGSGGAKGSTILNITAESSRTFPYLHPEQAKEILSKFFNLEQIDEQDMTAAMTVLQGRLRYVFRFITELYNVSAEINSKRQPLDKDTMNVIFCKALLQLQNSIRRNIHQRVAKKEKQDDFIWHLVDVLSAYEQGLALEWDSKEIETQYGISAEETGFLFMSQDKPYPKSTETHYYYSIREPYVAKVLNESQWIKRVTTDQMKKTIKSGIMQNLENESTLGVKFERFLLFYLASNAHLLGNYLPPTAPEWCKALKFEWNRAVVARRNIDLNRAVETLVAIKRDLKTLQKTKKKVTKKEKDLLVAAKARVLLNLQSDDFLKDIPGFNRKDGILEKTTLDMLYQISCASEDKMPELLFFFVKPLNMLLHPSNHFGPDLFGFLRESDSHASACVAVSISYRGVEDDEKFEKNVRKTDPKYFYTTEELKEYSIKSEFKPLLDTLPANIIRINITVPSPKEEPKRVSATEYLMHVNLEELLKMKIPTSLIAAIQNFHSSKKTPGDAKSESNSTPTV